MESKCAGMENRNCLGFGILLVVVTLWDKSGLRCEASVNYAVVYPTTDDDAPVSVDLFLTATYDVQAEIEGNVTQLTSYNEQTVATSSQRSDGIINVTIYDSYTALVTKGQDSGVNMDGFRPLPRSSLGSDYTVSAWPPSSGGYSFVVLAATDSGVDVTVEVPSCFQHNVTWMGVAYGNGTQLVINLKVNEIAQLNFTEGDPTGLRLWTSDGTAFGVISGAMETSVNGSLPGNFYDITPPTGLTGSFYIGVPVPGREELIWRFVSTADSVVAMFLLVQGGVGDESASLDKGEHYDFTTNASTPVLIYSLQPAVVSLVTPSDDSTPPTMAYLYPMNLWNFYYVISPLDSSGVMQEYVTITIASASSSGLRMTSSDGNTTGITGWVTFDAALFSVDFVSVRISGVTSLWHVSDEPFQVVQSSFENGWSYSFSAGCDLGFGKPTTTTSTASPTSASTLTSTITSTSTSSSSSTTTTTTATTTGPPTVTSTSTSTSTPPTTTQSTESTTPTTSTLNMTSAGASSSSTTSSSVANTSLSSSTLLTTSDPANSTSNSSSSPSSSAGSSFLPSWLDEKEEFVIAGGAAAGALLVVATVAGVAVAVRKHSQSYAVSRMQQKASPTRTTTRKEATRKRKQPNVEGNTSRNKLPERREKQEEDQAPEDPGRQRKTSTRSSILRMKLKKPAFVRRFSREGGYLARGRRGGGTDLTPVDTV